MFISFLLLLKEQLAQNNLPCADNSRNPRASSRGIRSSNYGKSLKVNANHLDFQDSTNDTEKKDFVNEEEVRTTNIDGKRKVSSKFATLLTISDW